MHSSNSTSIAQEPMPRRPVSTGMRTTVRLCLRSNKFIQVSHSAVESGDKGKFHHYGLFVSSTMLHLLCNSSLCSSAEQMLLH